MPFDWEALANARDRAAPERSYRARDGAELVYRHYPADGDRSLVLVHGSSASSGYLSLLAAAIAESGVASVYTPDLRGHGAAPARRGDVDRVDQLEDDLADLFEVIDAEHPGGAIALGGHSSGGGLAVRFAGGRHGARAAGYLLLAPFLGPRAPTSRPTAGGWARARLARIVPIALLGSIGARAFGGVPVLEFALPEAQRDGTETTTYSFRMTMAINPRNLASDVAAIARPVLVAVGSADEAVDAEAFAPLFAEAPARVEILPGGRHLGLVTDPRCHALAIDWLRSLPR